MNLPFRREDNRQPESLKNFIEACVASSLTHGSGELSIYEVEDSGQVQDAVERALLILSKASEDPQRHVRRIWVDGQGGIGAEWLLSGDAYRITLVTAAGQSEALAEFVLRMSRRLFR